MRNVDEIKEKFKPGTEIRLLSMNDPQAPSPGTKGVVNFVDDIGTVFVRWETGSSLGLIPEEDQFEIIGPEEERDEDRDTL